jgi:hypothetical protein
VAQAKSRSLLTSQPFGVTHEDLAVAIAGVDPTLDEGKLFLAIDPRGFIDESGHYLIHGSEYVQDLIANLPVPESRWEELRAGLRARGRATILRCQIPREWVTVPTGLVTSMLVDHAWSITNGRCSPQWLEDTVTLRHPVPPEMVVGVCHPVRIKDPHAGYRKWNEDLHGYEP